MYTNGIVKLTAPTILVNTNIVGLSIKSNQIMNMSDFMVIKMNLKIINFYYHEI